LRRDIEAYTKKITGENSELKWRLTASADIAEANNMLDRAIAELEK